MTRPKRSTRMSPAKPGSEIVVRHCHGLDEFRACIEIERAVWGSADADLMPLPRLVVAAETGGEVLGAFDGDNMVGFTLAVVGLHGRKPYLHSHMTAVREPYRSRGIARRLKLFQREDALARGIESVEWTFDPLEVKNAQFNFRLGAICRRYLPNIYGITSSPLHAGLPTDRLIAEWHLRSARVRRAIATEDTGAKASSSSSRPGSKNVVRIRVPVEISELKRNRSEEAARIQGEVRQEFEHWLSRGYAATGIEIGPQGGEYLLEPWRHKA